MLFFYRAYQRTTPGNVAIALLCLSLVPHFCLSSVLVVPFFMIVLLYKVYIRYTVSHSLKDLIVPGLAVLVGTIFYISLTYYRFFGDLFVFLLQSIQERIMVLSDGRERDFLENFILSFDYLSKYSWGMSPIWNRVLSVVGIATSVAFSFMKNDVNGKMVRVSAFILLMGCMPTYFLDSDLFDNYLIPLAALNLLLFACAGTYSITFLQQAILRRQHPQLYIRSILLFASSVSMMFLAAVYVGSLVEGKFLSKSDEQTYFFEDLKRSTDAIHKSRLTLEGSSLQNYDAFTLAGLFPYYGGHYGRDGWPSSSQWLLLELMTGERLVQVTDSRNIGLQFRPLLSHIDSVYLTCFHRGGT